MKTTILSTILSAYMFAGIPIAVYAKDRAYQNAREEEYGALVAEIFYNVPDAAMQRKLERLNLMLEKEIGIK